MSLQDSIDAIREVREAQEWEERIEEEAVFQHARVEENGSRIYFVVQGPKKHFRECVIEWDEGKIVVRANDHVIVEDLQI